MTTLFDDPSVTRELCRRIAARSGNDVEATVSAARAQRPAKRGHESLTHLARLGTETIESNLPLQASDLDVERWTLSVGSLLFCALLAALAFVLLWFWFFPTSDFRLPTSVF